MTSLSLQIDFIMMSYYLILIIIIDYWIISSRFVEILFEIFTMIKDNIWIRLYGLIPL